MTTPWKDIVLTDGASRSLNGDAAALTAEWNAVQATTLTPDQVRAVNRWAHLAAFGTEPPPGEPVDWRRAFPGRVITL